MDTSTPELSAKAFRDRLKQMREERFRWTQSDLAEQAKVSLVTISKLEQGKNLPTFHVLIALCTALKTSPNELLGWRTGGEAGLGQPLLVERAANALRRLPKNHAEAVMELAEKLAKG